ncbi:MAG TPA: Uma2 family endonuclease [Pyrinomonadaceae bacterium]|nr:Uma2 family endonuclease [Pyrinomonadaceae bacterium]
MAQEIETKAPAAAINASLPPKMTYEEFLDWLDEDVRAEWIDGEVIIMSPASLRHQLLVNFLAALLQHFVEAHQLGLIVTAPFQMKTGADLPGREPDLIFVSSEHLDRLKHAHLSGPADMALEIISPESRARDRGEKFYEYEQGGVREYWLIDPVRKQAEFCILGADGIYHLAIIGDDGLFKSAVLKGLKLKVDWLWQEPLPQLSSVLKEWGLV